MRSASPTWATCASSPSRRPTSAVHAARLPRGGIEPEVAGHGGDFGLTTALVVRGGAVALIPRMALRATDRVVGLRLSEPKLERRVVAATRAGSARVPAVAALLGALRRAAAPA
jgi:DNA-binding transcriptional LysR family regulator